MHFVDIGIGEVIDRFAGLEHVVCIDKFLSGDTAGLVGTLRKDGHTVDCRMVHTPVKRASPDGLLVVGLKVGIAARCEIFLIAVLICLAVDQMGVEFITVVPKELEGLRIFFICIVPEILVLTEKRAGSEERRL